MGRTTTWDFEAKWTEAELAWFGMGPFDGEILGSYAGSAASSTCPSAGWPHQ